MHTAANGEPDEPDMYSEHTTTRGVTINMTNEEEHAGLNSTHVRVTLLDLALRINAYYLLHRGNHEMSLEVENFVHSVKFCLTDAAITYTELERMLACGVNIAQEDICAKTPYICAFLAQIRRQFPGLAFEPTRG